jgi:leucyl aminopeptidase
MVGLGKKAKSTPEVIRKGAGLAIRIVRKLKTVAFLPVDDPQDTITPLIDGAILGDYRFDQLKSEKNESLIKSVYYFIGATNIPQAFVDAVRTMNEGTLIARDLSNMPSNLLTPENLAAEAVDLGKAYKIPVKVLDEAQIKRLKMGALLGVAQGSANRPKFVIWEYKGADPREAPIVLVGKGVTFDSGGISIKPAEGMEAMKGDMGGAAAVISALAVLGQLKPKINVVGITPLVENMPSGTSYRPGDVLTASNGRTIEVISTDAEGRLILADALIYAKRYNPKYVIDIATLTGACVVALGQNICAGIMGKDQGLIEALIEAGQQSGERLWQLPLWDDYQELIKTTVADMKNTGGKWGGAITAACLLANFAEGYTWAHLDIAGTDHEETGNHPYRYKGATGFGVRVLSRFILNEAGVLPG